MVAYIYSTFLVMQRKVKPSSRRSFTLVGVVAYNYWGSPQIVPLRDWVLEVVGGDTPR